MSTLHLTKENKNIVVSYNVKNVFVGHAATDRDNVKQIYKDDYFINSIVVKGNDSAPVRVLLDQGKKAEISPEEETKKGLIVFGNNSADRPNWALVAGFYEDLEEDLRDLLDFSNLEITFD